MDLILSQNFDKTVKGIKFACFLLKMGTIMLIDLLKNTKATANKTQKTDLSDDTFSNLLNSLMGNSDEVKSNLPNFAGVINSESDILNKFKSSKSELSDFLSKFKSLDEFKSAKNIDELINIAQNRGLNVKNISLSTIKEVDAIREVLQTQNINQNTAQNIETKINRVSTEEKFAILDSLQKDIKQPTKEQISQITPAKDDKNIKQVGEKNDKSDKKVSKESALSELLKNIESKIRADLKQNEPFSEALKAEIKTVENSNTILSPLIPREVTNDNHILVDNTKSQIDVKSVENIKKESEVVALSKDSIEQKIRDSKETVKKFVTDLKEKIDIYKPPIMKFVMELSPSNLGDVDVTILSRGNSLVLNLNSNPNAMQLFMQNSMEFKNSLINMGFADVSMNFNSNQNGGGSNQHQERAFREYVANSEFEEEIESLEVVIPQYI